MNFPSGSKSRNPFLRIFILFCISFIQILLAQGQVKPIDKDKIKDFFEDQEFDDAISYLLPIARNDSNDLEILSELAYAYYMNEDWNTALAYYQRIYAIDSTHFLANHYLALIQMNTDPEQAQVYTRHLIQQFPRKAVYYRNMGDLWRKRKQSDSALAYYRLAYGLGPGDLKSAFGLADILVDQNRFAEADKIIEAGLTRDSLHISFLKLRIRSAYESKDYPAAILPGERLIRISEGSLSPLTQLALSYYNLKQYTDCIRVCQYMKDAGMNTESINYYEARSWAQLKEFSKSNELLKICLGLAISRTAELYYYDLGENAESMKQFKSAIRQYDTAYYLFRNPLMNYNIGRIYEIPLKNPKLAQKYYGKYLITANPQTPEEKKAYRYVRSKWGKKNLNPSATK
jgi:tetratricopeptide (TPR) repeat protein